MAKETEQSFEINLGNDDIIKINDDFKIIDNDVNNDGLNDWQEIAPEATQEQIDNFILNFNRALKSNINQDIETAEKEKNEINKKIKTHEGYRIDINKEIETAEKEKNEIKKKIAQLELDMNKYDSLYKQITLANIADDKKAKLIKTIMELSVLDKNVEVDEVKDFLINRVSILLTQKSDQCKKRIQLNKTISKLNQNIKDIDITISTCEERLKEVDRNKLAENFADLMIPAAFQTELNECKQESENALKLYDEKLLSLKNQFVIDDIYPPSHEKYIEECDKKILSLNSEIESNNESLKVLRDKLKELQKPLYEKYKEHDIKAGSGDEFGIEHKDDHYKEIHDYHDIAVDIQPIKHGVDNGHATEQEKENQIITNLKNRSNDEKISSDLKHKIKEIIILIRQTEVNQKRIDSLEKGLEKFKDYSIDRLFKGNEYENPLSDLDNVMSNTDLKDNSSNLEPLPSHKDRKDMIMTLNESKKDIFSYLKNLHANSRALNKLIMGASDKVQKILDYQKAIEEFQEKTAEIELLACDQALQQCETRITSLEERISAFKVEKETKEEKEKEEKEKKSYFAKTMEYFKNPEIPQVDYQKIIDQSSSKLKDFQNMKTDLEIKICHLKIAIQTNETEKITAQKDELEACKNTIDRTFKASEEKKNRYKEKLNICQNAKCSLQSVFKSLQEVLKQEGKNELSAELFKQIKVKRSFWSILKSIFKFSFSSKEKTNDKTWTELTNLHSKASNIQNSLSRY